MGKLVVGDVVVVTFPFSNLTKTKLRPALVLANAEFNNVILCQITSRPYSSKRAISIESSDFAKGGLPVVSYVRPDKLFTADTTIIQKVAGHLRHTSLNKILTRVQKLFQA
jgi:mRNA interferase MazF